MRTYMALGLALTTVAGTAGAQESWEHKLWSAYRADEATVVAETIQRGASLQVLFLRGDCGNPLIGLSIPGLVDGGERQLWRLWVDESGETTFGGLTSGVSTNAGVTEVLLAPEDGAPVAQAYLALREGSVAAAALIPAGESAGVGLATLWRLDGSAAALLKAETWCLEP